MGSQVDWYLVDQFIRKFRHVLQATLHPTDSLVYRKNTSVVMLVYYLFYGSQSAVYSLTHLARASEALLGRFIHNACVSQTPRRDARRSITLILRRRMSWGIRPILSKCQPISVNDTFKYIAGLVHARSLLYSVTHGKYMRVYST